MDECDDCPPEGAPAWMATFSDLATLLLTFFVLLLSFAEMDVKAFRTMLGSVKDAFGVQNDHPGTHRALATTPIALTTQESTPVRFVLNESEAHAVEKLQRLVQQLDMQDDVEIMTSPRGLVVRLRDRLLFESGSDALSQDAEPLLSQIAELAPAFPAGLSIEGHTDDRPIHTARFPTNWELSSSRATAALRGLERRGALAVGRLRVVGYADTHPLDEARTDDARAKNRRVEFVFERPADAPTRAEDAPPDGAAGDTGAPAAPPAPANDDPARRAEPAPPDPAR